MSSMEFTSVKVMLYYRLEDYDFHKFGRAMEEYFSNTGKKSSTVHKRNLGRKHNIVVVIPSRIRFEVMDWVKQYCENHNIALNNKITSDDI